MKKTKKDSLKNKKSLKKILIFLSIATLFSVLLSFNASAATVEGQAGPDSYWSLDTNSGILTFSGSGYIEDSTAYDSFYHYRDSIKKVIIEEGITEIVDETFSYFTNLKTVSLPTTLKYIDRSAFLGSGLTSVAIPEGVVTIEKYSFSDCENLTSIHLPDSLRYIDGSAFNNNAYWYDESNWENNVLYIDNHLISVRGNYSDETLVIKDGTISVADGACGYEWNYPTFKNIVFPSSLKVIGEGAFANCSKLTEIVLPNGLERIYARAFDTCSELSKIKLPQTLTEIGEYAFWYTAFYDNNDNWDGNFLYIDNCLVGSKNTYDVSVCEIKDGTYLIADSACSSNSFSSIIIPETVKYIGAEAFASSISITSIEIPDSVIKAGQMFLSGCRKLEYIKFSDNMTEIELSSCYECTELKMVDLPAKLKVIGQRAFYKCESLNNVIIPEGVTTIEGASFSNCYSLSSISIPSTIQTVEYFWPDYDFKIDVYFTNTSTEKDCGFEFPYRPHVNCEYIEEKAPTCSKSGNTRGVYCPDCGIYVLGYTEIPAIGGSHSYTSVVKNATCTEGGFTTYSCQNCSYSYTDNFVSATGHSYGSNGVCSDCSEYNDAYNTEKEPKPCSCNCHKSGFMGFIWKILRIFYKLFNKNAVCACGVAHY